MSVGQIGEGLTREACRGLSLVVLIRIFNLLFAKKLVGEKY